MIAHVAGVPPEETLPSVTGAGVALLLARAWVMVRQRRRPVAARAVVVELFFGIEEAAPVLRGWRDLNAIAPRAATFTAWVGQSQSPVLAPQWRDRPVASVGFVWAGEPELERQLLPAHLVIAARGVGARSAGRGLGRVPR